jgi:hypothetical protein
VTAFLPYRGAALRLFSPLGLTLIDDFTGELPQGGISATVERLDGASWVPVVIDPVITPIGVLAFPGLYQVGQLALASPAQFRVAVSAELYRPFYRASSDFLFFTLPPWSQSEPPNGITPTLAQLILLPAFQYQFPTHVAVLRGEVVDNLTQAPLADALLTEPTTGERTLSDERGCFSLPLRKIPALGPTTLTIHVHARSGATTTQTVTLPTDLFQGQLIPV